MQNNITALARRTDVMSFEMRAASGYLAALVILRHKFPVWIYGAALVRYLERDLSQKFQYWMLLAVADYIRHINIFRAAV